MTTNSKESGGASLASNRANAFILESEGGVLINVGPHVTLGTDHAALRALYDAVDDIENQIYCDRAAPTKRYVPTRPVADPWQVIGYSGESGLYTLTFRGVCWEISAVEMSAVVKTITKSIGVS